MFNYQNCVKVGDFGWSYYSPNELRKTFCGTLEYVAPEIIKGEFYDDCVDIWSVGVVVYEMLTGKTPFDKINQQNIFDKIKEGDIFYPNYLSDKAVSFISGLLKVNKNERLNINQIKNHSFLNNN